MKTRYLLLGLSVLAMLWSCDPNDPDSEQVNHAPVVPDQSFTVPEAHPSGVPIGKLKATDRDGDALVFSLSDDQSGFFSLTKGGTLTLSEGKSLDHAKYPEHQLKVYVHDGTVGRPGNVTIKVVRTEPDNLPPTMEAQTFQAAEDIADTDVIGTVTANDPEEAPLTFTMVEDVDGLFEITEAGELSLAEGKTLDFETKQEHTITVNANDGNGFVQAIITIQVGDVDEAPTAEPQSFEVAEDIADTEIIGTVEADDPENDALTFSIVEDPDGLFEINEAGELSLATGKTLDFETKAEHVLTVGVSDGTNETVALTITITVTDVQEGVSLFDDPASFITEWQIDEVGQEITIGTSPNINYTFDFTIDWGDGTIEQITELYPKHQYQSIGKFKVAIKGQFPALYMLNIPEATTSALVDVVQWGTNKWQSMSFAFYNCINLHGFSATDKPNLSEVESMYAMFSQSPFNGDIGNWDVGNVTNMANMFANAPNFNQDISGWDVGNVTNMATMFANATNFNQDISGWDVSKVTIMHAMFFKAYAFNQDISDWIVDNVALINFMFYEATSFNQDISNWNTGNVTSMEAMFEKAASFNQDIGGWNTINVTNMESMFNNATSFDQNLGGWNISNITNMTSMFDNSGMSHTNTNATLAGWANFVQQNEGPFNIELGMENVLLCGLGADESLNILINDYNWEITSNYNLECP